ncbi:MAG TPA: hypothetical protein VH186_06500 [Chloroflexia bacterium]|nr:hypothetical protein [Chloroflexia bacterium]
MAEETTEVKLLRIENMANRGLKHAAAQLSRLILEKEPKNFDALVWLARTTTQPDEAEKALQLAAQLRPNDPAVQELMAARTSTNPNLANGPVPINPYVSNYASAGAGAANPVNGIPTYAPPPPGNNFPQAPVPPQWSYTPGNPPASSYDYLQNLTSSVQAPPPPVAPPVNRTKSSSKGGLRVFGTIIGLLLLLGGVALAVYWSLNVLDYNSDLSQPGSSLLGQIKTIEGTGSNWKLVADVQGQPERTFSISEQMFKTLEPLIRDSQKKDALAPNEVKLVVSPGGRLLTVNVVKPNTGTATNTSSGLLGLGQIADWSITVGGVLLALAGLLLLARSLSRSRA